MGQEVVSADEAPRPTEADVEAAESAACLCEHSTADHAWYGCAACGCRRSAIQAVLASDWLAARDAEHRRDRAGDEHCATCQCAGTKCRENDWCNRTWGHRGSCSVIRDEGFLR